MLFGKRIKSLEGRIDVLETRVNELLAITSKYCQEVDRLSALYQKQEQKQESAPKQPQKPRYRPRKNNGKENPKATE